MEKQWQRKTGLVKPRTVFLDIMNITVRFFAIGRELVGASSIQIEAPENSTIHEILLILKAQYPVLSSLPSFVMAINNAYADSSMLVHDGDELALIPPVSGG